MTLKFKSSKKKALKLWKAKLLLRDVNKLHSHFVQSSVGKSQRISTKILIDFDVPIINFQANAVQKNQLISYAKLKYQDNLAKVVERQSSKLLYLYHRITECGQFLNLIASNEILDIFKKIDETVSKDQQCMFKSFEQFFNLYKTLILPYQIYKSNSYVSKSNYAKLSINMVLRVQNTFNQDHLIRYVEFDTFSIVGIKNEYIEIQFTPHFKTKYASIEITQNVYNNTLKIYQESTYKLSQWNNTNFPYQTVRPKPLRLKQFSEFSFLKKKFNKIIERHHELNLLAYLQTDYEISENCVLFVRCGFYQCIENSLFTTININSGSSSITWYIINHNTFHSVKSYLQLNYDTNILENAEILERDYIKLLDNQLDIKKVIQKPGDIIYINSNNFYWLSCKDQTLLVSIKMYTKSPKWIHSITFKQNILQQKFKLNLVTFCLRILNHSVQDPKSSLQKQLYQIISTMLNKQSYNFNQLNYCLHYEIQTKIQQLADHYSFCYSCNQQILNYYYMKTNYVYCLKCTEAHMRSSSWTNHHKYVILSRFNVTFLNQLLELYKKGISDSIKFQQSQNLCHFNMIGKEIQCKHATIAQKVDQIIINIQQKREKQIPQKQMTHQIIEQVVCENQERTRQIIEAWRRNSKVLAPTLVPSNKNETFNQNNSNLLFSIVQTLNETDY